MPFQEKKTETSYKNNDNDVILYRDLNKKQENISLSFDVEKKCIKRF